MSKYENGEQAGARRPNDSQRTGLVDRLRSLIGLGPASVREDIEDALEDTAGDVTPHERTLLKNVLALHDLRVADAMIPRAAIVAVSETATLGEVLAVFRNAGHSRLPVYGETLDDPRGMVHIRDFVDYLARCALAPAAASAEAEHGPTVSLAAIDFSAKLASANVLKPVLFVPPSMPALHLLVRMQATRTHLALVIDEYGGTDGLVSMEDIVEMIVGDIEDEHDTNEEPRIEACEDGCFLADGRADLEDVARVVGVDFTQEEPTAEVTTLGGLVASLAGHVPMRSEIVQAPVEGWEFEIVDADPRRVARVRIHPPREERRGDTAASGERS